MVAAPTHLHKEIALAAFRRNLHVYMEKPLAADLAEARAIVRAAQRKNKVLSVYQPHRAWASNRHLIQIIDSGALGQVYQVRYGRFTCVRRDDWQSLKRYGGGMLNNYGAHYLDMLLHILGYDVKRAFCQMRRVLSLGDAEDAVKIIVEMRGGAIGEVDINQASTLSPFELEVTGTRGAIALENAVFHLRFFADEDLAPKKLNRSLASAGRQYPKDQMPFTEQHIPVDKNLTLDLYTDLACAIRQGKEPFVKPRGTLAVMQLMQQCRQDSGKILVTP